MTDLFKSYQISSVSPGSGNTAGGYVVTLSGFAFSGATEVHFGSTVLSGSALTVENANTIKVKAPPSSVAVPVAITVMT